MKQRDKSIDTIKGFLIICVVIGHAIANYNPVDCFVNPIFMLCYSFHMYLFFFVSGYLTGNRDELDKEWLKRRVTRLFVPYAVWTLIKFLTSTVLEKSVTSFLYVLIVSPVRWFLLILFIIEVLLYIVLKLTKKTIHQILLFIMMYVAFYAFGICLGHVGHNFKLAAIYMPFYVGGYFIRNKHIVLSKTKCLVFCGLYPLSLFFYSIENHERILAMVDDVLKRIGFNSDLYTVTFKVIEKLIIPFYNHIVVASLGCVFWWTVIRFLHKKLGDDNKVLQVISFVGRFSLQIYMLSDYFFMFSLGNDLLNVLLATFLGVVGPCIIAYFVKKRLPNLSKVLFGV